MYVPKNDYIIILLQVKRDFTRALMVRAVLHGVPPIADIFIKMDV
jgi:hypothetical protein